MKYLGVDYGTKRVGVAISDEAGEFAFPKAIYESAHALQEIAALCGAEQVGGVVIGESLASNGSLNAVSTKIEQFKEKLAELVAVPIYREGELFSSVEAHRYQTDKGARDDSAAAIILQRFLDRQKK